MSCGPLQVLVFRWVRKLSTVRTYRYMIAHGGGANRTIFRSNTCEDVWQKIEWFPQLKHLASRIHVDVRCTWCVSPMYLSNIEKVANSGAWSFLHLFTRQDLQNKDIRVAVMSWRLDPNSHVFVINMCEGHFRPYGWRLSAKICPTSCCDHIHLCTLSEDALSSQWSYLHSPLPSMYISLHLLAPHWRYKEMPTLHFLISKIDYVNDML